MKKHIPFLELASMHKDLAKALKEKFAEILENGIFSGGDEVAELERNLKRYLKVPFAISCANGTDALELALRALGIGPGDEVIVPALSWVSTAEVVEMVGAQVVFVDVDMDGLLDLELLKSRVTSRTKAVIPVHLYGKMVNMPLLMQWAKENNIGVVEDAAQALGAFQGGIAAGGYGDIGCFSFYPTKNLGALGEAGLVVTSHEEWARKIALLRNHGQPLRNVHELAGKNSRIDTLQAAFLNVKWGYFSLWQERRKSLAEIYMKRLGDISGCRLPDGIDRCDHNAHLLTIQCEERDALKGFLEERGIGTAVHYSRPLPHTPAFRDEGDYPVAQSIAHATLSLPLHPYLREGEVGWVCQAIREFYGVK